PRAEGHRGVGAEDFLLVPGKDLAAALEDVVHRFDRAVFVRTRAPSRPNLDHGDDELARPDVRRRVELIGKAPVPLERLRLLAWHDLHSPAPVSTGRRALRVSGFPAPH